MSNFPNTNHTFAGAAYRLIIPNLNQLAPAPEPGDPGEWVHIPHGGNKHESDGSALHTVWTPQGGIVIPTQADYAIFNAHRRKFATLTTKWGTFSARLAKLDVGYFAQDGSYRGSVTWEWA